MHPSTILFLSTLGCHDCPTPRVYPRYWNRQQLRRCFIQYHEMRRGKQEQSGRTGRMTISATGPVACDAGAEGRDGPVRNPPPRWEASRRDGRRAFIAFRQQHDEGNPAFRSGVPCTSSMLLAQSAKCPAEGRNPDSSVPFLLCLGQPCIRGGLPQGPFTDRISPELEKTIIKRKGQIMKTRLAVLCCLVCVAIPSRRSTTDSIAI